MKTETTLIGIKTLTLYQNIVLGLSFLVPFLVSGPQLLTGSLVNLFLISGTRLVDKKSHWLMAVLPSVAAALNGLVFGKFTPFLIYFLPFIWLGNMIYISSFIKFQKSLPILINILVGALLKSSFLFIFTVLFFKLAIVPQIFLTAMGIFQLITAIIGGLVFLGINKLVKNENLIIKNSMKIENL